MRPGVAKSDGGRPGPSVTVTGTETLVEHLPAGYGPQGPAATAVDDADVLVVDRRTARNRTENPGEARIDGRRVVVLPARPGARPSVDLYSQEDPATDPAVDLVRRAVELDACTAAHFRVASRMAVAGDGGAEPGRDGSPPAWATADEGRTPATGAGGAPADGDAVADTDAEPTGISPSAAELRARRDSVDDATGRLLDETGADDAAPLAFCGLSAVVEPLDGV